MPRTKRRAKTCERKKKYTWKEANIKANELNAKGHYLKAYKCPNCRGWHIGHPYHEARVAEAFRRLVSVKRPEAGRRRSEGLAI